jgi:hypothetical protein
MHDRRAPLPGSIPDQPVSLCPAAYRGVAGFVRSRSDPGGEVGVLLLERHAVVESTSVANNDNDAKYLQIQINISRAYETVDRRL